MLKEEYYEKKEKLFINYNTEMDELNNKYALAHSNIKIGEIVSDKNKSIIVDRMGCSSVRTKDKLPQCYYVGYRLKSIDPLELESGRAVINQHEVTYVKR